MSDADASFSDLIARATPNIAERLKAIRDATCVDEQRRAISETLLLWGAGAVPILERIPGLSERASPLEVLLGVLRGELVTGRADELRRRAELSRQVIASFSSGARDVPLLLGSVAAEALLQIADRNGELVKIEERERACTVLLDAASEAEEFGYK